MGVQDLAFRMLVLVPFIGPRHCFADGRFLKGWPSSAICYYLKHFAFLLNSELQEAVTVSSLSSRPQHMGSAQEIFIV